jgi:hypothetical protein
MVRYGHKLQLAVEILIFLDNLMAEKSKFMAIE